ncbi:MAG TPA: hypothetical protein VNJ08_07065 [Bacteriovoracaceae bacterium]|nr:hypothetical protein [Bacteriovoracaceae bacterium]
MDEADAKVVVFRYNNNAWTRVHEVTLPRTLGTQNVTVTPAVHFCEDLYAIRVMSGTRTLAGAVHFQAGVGTCSSTDTSKFVNLEHNLLDLVNFAPVDQGSRDTCGSFAAAAGLSAAYKRLKGHNVLLSKKLSASHY